MGDGSLLNEFFLKAFSVRSFVNAPNLLSLALKLKLLLSYGYLLVSNRS
jgi:hypothetical protein